jgi:hypothetical protein
MFYLQRNKRKLSICKQTKTDLLDLLIYSICEWIYVKRPKKALKGKLHKAKGDSQDRVHSDKMVLRTVR